MNTELDRQFHLMKAAHHELISSIPRIEDNMKKIESLVISLKNTAVFVDQGEYARLVSSVCGIIKGQRERLEKLVGRVKRYEPIEFPKAIKE